jgi:hypothetical protein
VWVAERRDDVSVVLGESVSRVCGFVCSKVGMGVDGK